MNKVICDICGTAYPSNEKNCPICGSSREYALENLEQDISRDAAELFAADEIRSEIRKKSKEIFDFDEVNQVKAADRHNDEYDEDDEEEYEEESHTNVGLVVILLILVVLLLLASGFFFIRYMLPNMKDEPVQTEPVAVTQPIQTEPVETTEPTIPCTNLSMDGGKMELGKDGKKLLNVRIYPENTTDTLVYSSADESIVTVSEDGTVTAVAEGQTVITVQCGAQQITCNVTVSYAEAEATVPDSEVPAPQVEGEQTADATEATEESDADETEAATEATEATGATEAQKQALKLKQDDITIGANYTSVQLELEGDIKPEDVKWFTMDSTVAICHDGLVTATGSGMTRIYGEYQGDQVVCIIRCIF
jgi:hypothetical protein